MSVTKSAIQLAILSTASLVLSLGFQVAVAALFGASSDHDAFWIALALPKAIVDSVHLGLLTIVFILIFNEPQSEAELEGLHAGCRWCSYLQCGCTHSS